MEGAWKLCTYDRMQTVNWIENRSNAYNQWETVTINNYC